MQSYIIKTHYLKQKSHTFNFPFKVFFFSRNCLLCFFFHLLTFSHVLATCTILALLLSGDLVFDQRDLQDLPGDPQSDTWHSSENLQDQVDETTDILIDTDNNPLHVIDSIVDESIKTGALPHPVEGAVNVNIINVYVDMGKIISAADSTQSIMMIY